MYRIFALKKYTKSLRRISQHKDFDIKKHKELIRELSNSEPLASQYKDHELKGEFVGIRECHIQNDILLLYRKEKKVLILLLVNIGTHSNLFE